MRHTDAPTPKPPAQPDPENGRGGEAVPYRIGIVLYLVRLLLGHGSRLAQTTPEQAAKPAFSTIAAVAGTHNLDIILARLRRGMLRLRALEHYLLSRAKRGKDLAFVEKRAKPETKAEAPAQKEAKPARPRRPPYDPNSLYVPTYEAMLAEVKRQPVGRGIIYACMDLAVVPGFCTPRTWTVIADVADSFGGSLARLQALRAKRRVTFQRERDQRPETWDWVWHDVSRAAIVAALGYKIGDDPPYPIPIPS